MAADIEYATIAAWRKQEGDSVIAGDPILEIETDKVTEEVCSYEAGAAVCSRSASASASVGR
ncbi:MAG: hypothetical protein H0V18_12235 [Pyrinomonadaceae bacterium]|nr:hypothetical protein [Pyrinomonadaceae bacterium]